MLRERWTVEQAEQAKQAGLGQRKRDGKDPEVEEALNLCFSSVLAEGIRISGQIL